MTNPNPSTPPPSVDDSGSVDFCLPHLIDLDETLENSFRDFHVKGFDYLCLLRSPELTVKAYFFDGDVASAPEVVNPHDHRYPFTTTVLSGEVANRQYVPITSERYKHEAEPYERFDYLTPLNGGSGFTWAETQHLFEISNRSYRRGAVYHQRAEEVHTIQLLAPQTVLVLHQFADVVPVDVPTRTWRRDTREAPSLSGLYRQMDADHAIMRIKQYRQLVAALEGNQPTLEL